MEVILVLHNIRSTYNVGAILRTAEGFGVKEVILSGWTPATKYTASTKALPHILEKTTVQIAKTALGAEEMVECEWSDNIANKLVSLKEEGYVIFGLENNLELDNIGKLANWKETMKKIEENRVEKGTDEKNSGRMPKGEWCELDEKAVGEKVQKLVLVLGEEVNGIDNSLFPMIDWFFEIPMAGRKESFNVSVAAGIAMYELLGRDL